MTAELELIRDEVVPMPDELAAVANQEHSQAIQAGAVAIHHAIRAGDALLLARQQVDHGQWERWLAEHFDGTHQTARVYMRIARNADAVRDAGVPSINAADKLLTSALDTRVNPVLRAQALALKRQGVRVADIAEQLGISKATAQRWANPTSEARQRKRVRASSRKARRALKRAERDVAARKIGGPLAESYSLVRRALDALEQASAEADNPDARRQIRGAMTSLYNAEDAVSAAIRSRAADSQAGPV